MTILAPVAAGAGRLSPVRRTLAAMVAGAVGALALPPLFILPALPVVLVVLLWLLDGVLSRPRQHRAAFWLGWCFGFGHFVAGLYWIANALLVDAERFGWLAPIAVAGLSAYFALYPALAVLAAARAPAGLARIIALAAAWTLAEYLRGIVFTGFPWNPLGSVLAVHPALMQGAALGGAFALSFFVVLVAALPATLGGANALGRTGARRWYPTLAAGALFAFAFAGGALRLAGTPTVLPEGTAGADAPRLRIVQGAIPQAIKWRPELTRQHFGIYLRLSRDPLPDGGPVPHVVIWPETAVPAIYNGASDFIRAVAQAVPPDGLVVTGVVRRDPPAPSGAPGALWNSVIAVDGSGHLLARYDKHHLVPFGEYVPLARFNPLPKLTEGRVDFSAGPGPVTLALPGLPPLSPLVCYEAIFPGAVTAPGGPRPGLLLNVTNDAWFGRASGPYQHLVAAQMRAVEEGLPLVRAANTGISALIDPYGRVLASLGLGQRGALDVTVPPALTAPPFGRFGNLPILVLAGFVLIAAGRWRPRA